ncbi:TetR/AcrR family transcriptional regulator [Alkalihalobacillus sp. FSL R5-0424]
MITAEIKKVALTHFIEFGYEGTKMARIASDAGIRKQSLSYHYSTKKQLLMELYNEILIEEQQFMAEFFSNAQQLSVKELLYLFLNEMKRRFYEKPNVHFLQGMSFQTTSEVSDYVLSKYRLYLHSLKTELLSIFETEDFKLSAAECVLGYVTIFDGLIIQLVYENKQAFERALDTTFKIYWQGIN